ncbi:MAG: chromosomal replication initiator protein DnaA [Zetaproteobacteria bacterium]|nr:chromosomal replication initiator protein DnaA [Zetaproteobacteria bacterium]
MNSLFNNPGEHNSQTRKKSETLFLEDSSQPSPCDAWHCIQVELHSRLDPDTYRNWILPIKCEPNGPHSIKLITEDLICYQAIKGELLVQIFNCRDQLGFSDIEICVDFDRSKFPEFEQHLTEEPIQEAEKSPLLQHKAVEPLPKAALHTQTETPQPRTATSSAPAGVLKPNPNYTFENFVRGASNQFALASCLNVAANPGDSYNPLFLYGSTGLGKTHLLHAVGNKVRETRPDLVVSYISSERFMNEMIHCIRHNKMWDFRHKYRHSDVFLMDDIQFISGNKAATQEEFFHTFNSLYEAKKQIIITSDLFPQDIPEIEERLRNRFQWGLIADIQPPDMEHRVAILMAKADQLQIELNLDLAEYIAHRAKRNVRELEGALHRIAAFASLQGRPVDKSLATEIFVSLSGSSAPKQIEVSHIQKKVAEHFKVRLGDLKSAKRHRHLSLPRQVAMFLSRKYTEASFPEIGKKFGGKNHTTVMHAVKKIDQERLIDMDLKASMDSIERALEKEQTRQL